MAHRAEWQLLWRRIQTMPALISPWMRRLTREALQVRDGAPAAWPRPKRTWPWRSLCCCAVPDWLVAVPRDYKDDPWLAREKWDGRWRRGALARWPSSRAARNSGRLGLHPSSAVRQLLFASSCLRGPASKAAARLCRRTWSLLLFLSVRSANSALQMLSSMLCSLPSTLLGSDGPPSCCSILDNYEYI